MNNIENVAQIDNWLFSSVKNEIINFQANLWSYQTNIPSEVTPNWKEKYGIILLICEY